MRTGDTPQRERARFARHPAEILITTPESLYLLLTSQAAEALRTVETVIVDEIHALVPTKRGAHLALTLERLEALTAKPLQRIGLSATQRPLEEVARFLGGVEVQGAREQGSEGARRPGCRWFGWRRFRRCGCSEKPCIWETGKEQPQIPFDSIAAAIPLRAGFRLPPPSTCSGFGRSG